MFAVAYPADQLHHLALPARKMVVPLVVFARTVDANLGCTDLIPIINQMRSNVRLEALQIDGVTNDTMPLDKHLRNTYKSISRYSRKAAGSAALSGKFIQRQQRIRAIALRFARAVRSIDCGRCGNTFGHTCDGSHLDDQTVSNGGECWRPLLDVYDFCVSAVERLYETNANSCGLSAVSVTIKTIAGKHGIDTLRSSTGFSDKDASSRCSIVKVELPVNDFQTQHYYNHMYMVFHELFVHAPQQLCSNTDKRVPLGEECAFGEGLMDSLGYEALSVEMSNAPDAIAPLREPFRCASRQLHTERFYWLAGARSASSGPVQEREAAVLRARATGEKVFEQLMNTWRLNQIMACLIPLNVDDVSRVAREALVQELYSRAVEEGPAWGEALDALQEYRDSHNLQALLDTVIPGVGRGAAVSVVPLI